MSSRPDDGAGAVLGLVNDGLVGSGGGLEQQRSPPPAYTKAPSVATEKARHSVLGGDSSSDEDSDDEVTLV